MTVLAVIAVAVPTVVWLGIRWAEETERLDLTTYLLSIPADEWEQEVGL